MAAERSATGKTSRERCLCWVLSHMSGLLECHAELRDALLRAGGGYDGNAGRASSRLRRAGGILAGRRAWRQRPAVAMPVHQMLVVLGAENWPAFDRPELEELERRVLDEAAELFAEVVAGRRAAGRRTHELTDGAAAAAATLDSPATRVWAQVLGEVQRRTEGAESDIVLRCEGVRRREAERFRCAPAQVAAFLQDLAASVGCSDSQWSVVLAPSTVAAPAPAAPAPAPAPAPTVVVRRSTTASASAARKRAAVSGSGSSGTRRVPVSVSPSLPLSPPLQPPDSARGRDATDAATASRHPVGRFPETDICAATRSLEPEVKEACDGEEPRQLQPEPAGLDRTGPDSRHDSSHASGGYRAANAGTAPPPPRERTEQEVGGGGAAGARKTETERLPPSVDFAWGREEGRGKNDDDGTWQRRPTAGPLEPVALDPPRNSSAQSSSSAPSGRVAEPAQGGAATTASALPPAATAMGQPAAGTTMASAAKFLLARTGAGGGGEGRTGGSTTSPSPPPPSLAEPQGASSAPATSARGETEGSSDAAVGRQTNSGGRLERTNGEGEDEAQRRDGLEEEGAAEAGRDRPDRRERPSPPRVHQPRARESPPWHQHGIAAFRVLLSGESEEARPVFPPPARVGALAPTAVDEGPPSAEQRHTAPPQRSEGGVGRDTSEEGRKRRKAGTVDGDRESGGGGGVASGDTPAGDSSSSSSSEATRRLLREALRVKRLIDGMDKEDTAAAAAAGSSSGAVDDNGLKDEDPERFLASLGLVEPKPLSARLVEALDRAGPRAAVFGDPSAAVSEPRTTRGLRDQVRGRG